MNAAEYLQAVKKYQIEQFGFDTQARVLGISKDEAKSLWNSATGRTFKRVPRTEYTMRYLPEISTKRKPFWKLETPDKFLMFYLTPTAPIIIPDQFITDKGSIPLLFQNIVSIYDREMMFAFLVHDVECEMQRMTRFMTDGLIYEVGSEMQTNWLRKNVIYTAVRAGNRYGKKDVEVNGFNVSAYNQLLIEQAEKDFLENYYTGHLKTIEKLNV